MRTVPVRREKKGGQARTQRGMLGMGKSRKDSDRRLNGKKQVLGRCERKGLKENKGKREGITKKTQQRERLLTDS